MNLSFAQILRSFVAVLGLAIFCLSVGRLLWPGGSGSGKIDAQHLGVNFSRTRDEAPKPRADMVKSAEVAEADAEVPPETEPEPEPEPEPADSGEFTVVLDPGHGGSDPGSVREGHYEKNINLAVAKRVRTLLEAEGIRVRMTRTKDVAMELDARVAVANRYRNSIFVSIHQNASLETAATGVETYYAWPRPASVVKMQRERYGIPETYAFEDERGQKLASMVQDVFCKETKALSRGTKNRNFVVIRWVHGPAVLVECGFLSNSAERAKLLSDSYQDKVADGIAGGLIQYAKDSGRDMLFGLRFPSGSPPERGEGPRRTVVQALPSDS